MILERRNLFASSKVEVEKGGLHAIVDACQMLLAQGATTRDELWPGEIPELQSLVSNKKAFEVSRASYQRLKSASRVLARLQESVDAKVVLMGQAVAPASFHHGFLSLSDDVLAIIVKCCVDSVIEHYYHANVSGCHSSKKCWTIDDIRRFSLVSEAFKKAIYKHSPCWSIIGGNCVTSRDDTSKVLERNQCGDLHAILYGRPELLRAVKVNSSRIVSLDTGVYGLSKMPKGLNLGRLHTLSLRRHGLRDHQFFTAEPRNPRAYLERRDLPNLRHLTIDSVGFAPPVILERLTSLTFNWVIINETEEMYALLDDLRESPSLRELIIGHLNVTRRVREPSRQRYHVRLPFLKRLSLEIRFADRDLDDDLGSEDESLVGFGNIMPGQIWRNTAAVAEFLTQSLVMPGLRHLDLSFDDYSAVSSGPSPVEQGTLRYLSIDRLFPSQPESEMSGNQVTTLVFKIARQGGERVPREARRLLLECLRRFQNAGSLSFEASKILQSATEDSVWKGVQEFAKLQHLCLLDTSKFSLPIFQSMMDEILCASVIKLESVSTKTMPVEVNRADTEGHTETRYAKPNILDKMARFSRVVEGNSLVVFE